MPQTGSGALARCLFRSALPHLFPLASAADPWRLTPQVTPYEGVDMVGRVKATFVRGQLVFADGEGVAPRACGVAVLLGGAGEEVAAAAAAAA